MKVSNATYLRLGALFTVTVIGIYAGAWGYIYMYTLAMNVDTLIRAVTNKPDKGREIK